MINKKRVFDEFKELTSIYCPSLNEREVADILTKKLNDIGFSVIEDNAGEKLSGRCGNLIATLEANAENLPSVMFAGHMDCVEPCKNIKIQKKNNALVSDGATILGADDKSGLCGILEAMRFITENNLLHGLIQVVFTIGEEGGLNGSKNIDRHLLRAKYGYVVDSSGRPGKIIIKAPGQNHITIKIHGKKAHAGLAPETGINAIVKASKIISLLPQGRIDEETTCNIGIISGGQATNIVPDLVTLFIESRSCSIEKLNKITEEIVKSAQDTAQKEGIHIDIKVEEKYKPYNLGLNTPLIKTASLAAEKTGLHAKKMITGGGSDANVYNQYGIMCTNLGTGMQKAHTTEEFIFEEDLYTLPEWIINIVKTIPSLLK